MTGAQFGAQFKRSMEVEMTTNKWFFSIFSIVILIALVFTVQGISANAEQAKKATPSKTILNAGSARFTGLAGRTAAEIGLGHRMNSIHAARLTVMSEDYVSRLVKINSPQAARLTVMSEDYVSRLVKINSPQAARLTVMSEDYVSRLF